MQPPACVGDLVGSFVGDLVGAFDGCAVGEVVGYFVGFAVGFVVGALVGIAVGNFVGIAVGYAVGYVVGTAVGIAVGNFVGARVGAAVHTEHAALLHAIAPEQVHRFAEQTLSAHEHTPYVASHCASSFAVQPPTDVGCIVGFGVVGRCVGNLLGKFVGNCEG